MIQFAQYASGLSGKGLEKNDDSFQILQTRNSSKTRSDSLIRKRDRLAKTIPSLLVQLFRFLFSHLLFRCLLLLLSDFFLFIQISFPLNIIHDTVNYFLMDKVFILYWWNLHILLLVMTNILIIFWLFTNHSSVFHWSFNLFYRSNVFFSIYKQWFIYTYLICKQKSTIYDIQSLISCKYSSYIKLCPLHLLRKTQRFNLLT